MLILYHLELLASSGLLDAEHASGLVDYLIRVYPGHTYTQVPINWADLAASLLDTTWAEVTRRLLLKATEAGCIAQGDLPAT